MDQLPQDDSGNGPAPQEGEGPDRREARAPDVDATDPLRADEPTQPPAAEPASSGDPVSAEAAELSPEPQSTVAEEPKPDALSEGTGGAGVGETGEALASETALPKVSADTAEPGDAAAHAEEPEPARPSLLGRLVRIVLFLVLFVLCLVAGAIGWLYLSGPVHVPFVAQWLAGQASVGPARLTIGDASFDISSSSGIQVVLHEAHLRVEGEVPVEVTLPRLEAPIEPRALLSGKLHFASLDLVRPRVVLGVPQAQNKDLPPMAGLMEAINRVADVIDLQFSRRNLAIVRISDGSLRMTGALARRFQGINATLTRDISGRLTGQARIAGRFGPWEMRFDRLPGLEAGPDTPAIGSQFGVKFRDITIGDLLDSRKTLQQGKGLGLPMSAEFLAQFDGQGAFDKAGAVGRVTKGWFRLGRTSVRFDDAAVELAWRRDAPVVEIRRSHVIQGNSRIFWNGEIRPPEDGASEWALRIVSDYPQFGSSDIPDEPVMLDQVLIDGRVDTDSRTVFIDKARITAGPAQLQGSASVDLLEDGPYLVVVMEGEKLPVGLVKQVWPITLVPPARQWMIERLTGGLVDHVAYSAAVRPPAFNAADPDPGWSGNDLRVDMAFSGASLLPVGEVGEIRDLTGTLTVADETLTVDARGGTMADPSGGTGVVQVPEGTFRILNLPLRSGKIAELDVDLAGDAGPVSEVFNAKPFEILKKAKLSSQGVTGTGTVSLSARFPLEGKVELQDVEWRATAEAKGFTSPNEIQGHSIAKGDIRLDADPSRVAITGQGLLDGLPADIDLVMPLDGSDVEARQGVAVTANAKQLKERGIDLTQFVEGPMELNLQDLGEGGKRFDVDLTPARVKLTPLGWSKGKGIQASASFLLKEAGDEIRIGDFRLKSEGVDVTGDIRLSSKGELLEANFSRFHLRSGDAVALQIRADGSKRYAVTLNGKTFDARGVLTQILRGGESGEPKSKQPFDVLTLDVSLDQVIGFDGKLSAFSAEVEMRDEKVRYADLAGQVTGSSPFRLVINASESGGGRQATGEFSDVGGLLRFLDLYERMRGGQGRLAVKMPDDQDWKGTFRVRNLSITDDPALKTLGARGSVPGQPARSGELVPPETATTGAAAFDQLELVFVRSGDLLSVTRGALQGAVFGGTVSGDVDLDAKTLNLTGTFVPIYALNNIFSKIPILGFALGGSSKEGLIGVTYRVTGALAEPVLTVNPMSAIAPGIFRKMFEFQQ